MEDAVVKTSTEAASEATDVLTYWSSWLATIFTIGVFSSGILTCRKIHRNKSVGSLPHMPFVAAFLNCSMWMAYGILKPDSLVTYVNSIGLFMQLLYILVYHTYTESKHKIQRDFLAALTVVVCTSFYYAFLVSDHMIVTSQLGIICNICTIFFFGAPLLTLAEVVRSKSTETLSFPLSVMCFCASLSWTVYGMMAGDPYIVFPNCIGLILATTQVSLFVMYKQKPKGIVSMETPIV